MLVNEHPILDQYERGKEVRITFDGQEVTAYEGQVVAAALLAAGFNQFRVTQKEHKHRGLFCGIGRCTDCMMIIDGKPNTRTCVTRVHDGMVVQTQYGRGKWEEADNE